jgi:hypothetical protein
LNAYVERPDCPTRSRPVSLDDLSLEKLITTSNLKYVGSLEGFVETMKSKITDSCFRVIDSETDRIASEIHEKFPNFSLIYCKSVIEKKVYSKLYPKLLEHYSVITSGVDSKFSQKKMRISNMNSTELLKTLQVSSNFLLTGVEEPYEDAKVVLKRFNKLKTPIEKINCLIAAVACMKACVVEYWKGHLEIQAMDDELPVIMFLLLTSDIQSPSAELTILANYVAGRLENEGRIILNFNSAVSYLSVNFNF